MDLEARQPGMKRERILLGALLLATLGAVAASSRTARVRTARIISHDNVTAKNARDDEAENYTHASATSAVDHYATVALEYTSGPRPQYVIIDVRGEGGSGSATSEGGADEVRVLLSGSLGHGPKIEVTTYTRALGRLWTRQVVFEE